MRESIFSSVLCNLVSNVVFHSFEFLVLNGTIPKLKKRDYMLT